MFYGILGILIPKYTFLQYLVFKILFFTSDEQNLIQLQIQDLLYFTFFLFQKILIVHIVR